MTELRTVLTEKPDLQSTQNINTALFLERLIVVVWQWTLIDFKCV